MFFVVDVETSGLNPWNGQLLTVGICPVTEEAEVLYEETLYIELMHSKLDPREAKKKGYSVSDTYEFWLGQEDSVIDAAFNGTDKITKGLACTQIQLYMEALAPEYSQRFLAANPVKFDAMWLEYLFASCERDNPYHYRGLCLRSMRFGLDDDPTFGSVKGDHESKIPHHALHDAIAEANDLSKMITKKRLS